ncbi:hypothetical protein [Streptomyces sp. NPDC000405]|uniref:hypothetical protein n=1 Tax=Streptomyces sp. NPDC000405 TaxID=3161033 RepID=UPI00398CFD83
MRAGHRRRDGPKRPGPRPTVGELSFTERRLSYLFLFGLHLGYTARDVDELTEEEFEQLTSDIDHYQAQLRAQSSGGE